MPKTRKIYNKEKNKLAKTDPELTEMLKLTDKDIGKSLYYISFLQKARGKIEYHN